jgi:hypothetical protein
MKTIQDILNEFSGVKTHIDINDETRLRVSFAGDLDDLENTDSDIDFDLNGLTIAWIPSQYVKDEEMRNNSLKEKFRTMDGRFLEHHRAVYEIVCWLKGESPEKVEVDITATPAKVLEKVVPDPETEKQMHIAHGKVEAYEKLLINRTLEIGS